MSKVPSLYDLYGPTSLLNLERSIADGKMPSGPEIAAVLEANSDKLLPPWFIAIVVKSLRGELKKRPGRPKENSWAEIRFAIASWKYTHYLAWLQKRPPSRSCPRRAFAAMSASSKNCRRACAQQSADVIGARLAPGSIEAL